MYNFTDDIEGTKFFSKYLIKNGFYNIQTTAEFCGHDLEADYKGKTYYFELKRRDISADTWGDSICEQHKIDSTPDPNRTYLVNFFTDCFTIIPITAQHETQSKMCQKTNNWNRKKVLKNLLCYPNKKEYRHNYEETVLS